MAIYGAHHVQKRIIKYSKCHYLKFLFYYSLVRKDLLLWRKGYFEVEAIKIIVKQMKEQGYSRSKRFISV